MTFGPLDAIGGGAAALSGLMQNQQSQQYQNNLAAQQQNLYAQQLQQMLGANYISNSQGLPPLTYIPPSPPPPRCAYCGVRYATRVGTCTSCGAPL